MGKEEALASLKKLVDKIHEKHKGEPGHYRINVIGSLAGGLSKEELESIGCTVREMPNIKGKKNG